MRRTAPQLALRAIAVMIAIGGVFDPAVTSSRRTRPDVVVLAASPHRDSALAARVARALSKSFTVTTAPFPIAAAIVLVGDRLPADPGELHGPAFAVLNDSDSRSATIERLEMPAWAPLDSRVPVTAAARGSLATATLDVNGVVVDRRQLAGADANDIRMEFTPAAPGAQAIHVEMAASDGQPVTADAAIDIRDQQWPVLFYDPRPSWSATFVRRAIEGDGRFRVTSRVITSRNISTDAGTPPSSLETERALEQYAAIVVGAPGELTDRDVAGLDRYMRQRGGSVVFVLDQLAPGAWQRLAGAAKWVDGGSGRLTGVGIVAGDSSLRGSEFAWPALLPAGAFALVRTVPVTGDTTARHPVIWRLPVGAGGLIVSGALDAWRYRDPAQSTFDSFWRTTIANAAAAAPSALAVSISPSAAAPGERVVIDVTARDVALRPLPGHIAVAATLQSVTDGSRIPLTLWPGDSPGELRAVIRAPADSGAWRVVAAANGNRDSAVLLVSDRARHPGRDDRDLVTSWVNSRGGRTFAFNELDQLTSSLRLAISPPSYRQRWHPLRSAWWLLPFTLVLSAEWWLRRRRGLP